MYFVPVKPAVMVENYGVFHGPNPWDDGREARWVVGGFRWGSKKPHDRALTDLARSKGKRPHGIWAGLQCTDLRIVRLLPPGLQELWWTGQLQAKDIPWLLHELAPKPVDAGTVIRSAGSEQMEAKQPPITPGTVILALCYALCALLLVVAIATGFRAAVHDLGWLLWISLVVTVVVPALWVYAVMRDKREAVRVKNRALELLRQRGAGAM